MTKDHSPSQTYLKAFLSLDRPNFLNIYRKSDPSKPFLSRPSKVCYEKNGDGNTRFKNHLILRSFLQPIEQRWPNVISDLEEQKIKKGTLGVIAAYLAYLKLLSPVAKRCNTSLIAQDLNNIREFQDKYSKNNSVITSSLTEDQIQISIDRDFANAPAILALVPLSFAIGKGTFCILYNNTPKPFLTSDNPAIPISMGGMNGFTYFPLTPSISIVLQPDPKIASFPESLQEKDFDNATCNFSILNIKERRVEEFNNEIVKFTEDKVISNINASWITELIQKFQHYRTENVSTKIDDSTYMYQQQAVGCTQK